MAQERPTWLDQLADNIGARRLCALPDNEKWDPATWPQRRRVRLPRGPARRPGALDPDQGQQILNYQAVVPSTWNASPRDAKGQMGAYEATLIGTPIADPNKPLEILRTIHSFDPCLACAVHVIDPDGNELVQVKVL